MIKSIKLLLIFVIFFPLLCFGNYNNQKIAIVDIQLILDNSKAINSIKSQTDIISLKLQEKFQKAELDLKSFEMKLQQMKYKVSDEEFNKEVKIFNEMLNAIQKNSKESRAQLEKSSAEAIEEVNKTALKIIAKIAEEKNYDIILPLSYILFSDKKYNITADVIKELDNTLSTVKVKF